MIYIAGPITGVKNYKMRFRVAEAFLKQHTVQMILNPAEMIPERMENKDALPICLRMIDQCDVVYFLPGWEESRGAQIERAYCEYTGKRIEDLEFISLAGIETKAMRFKPDGNREEATA